MRTLVFLFASLIAPAQVVVTLRDGSEIVGRTSTQSLQFTSTVGELTVPVGMLLSFEEQQLRLTNGDHISSHLRTPQLPLATAFGDLRIPQEHIQGLRPSYLKGIVSWWNADGDAGDRWGRHSGGGTCGYTQDRHGRPNGAFLFHNGADTVSVPDHAELDTVETFTLAAWIWPTAFKGPKGHRSFVIGKWYSSPTAGNYILGFSEPPGALCINLSHNKGGYTNAQLNTPGDTVPLNRWTHIAATFDRGQTCLFVNGQLVISEMFPEVTFTNRSEYRQDHISIGGHWNDTYGFRGAIDDVMLFKRALLAAEIAALAQNP